MNNMSQSKDVEIRSALHRKRLKAYHATPGTIVVDELGLSHAKARIDVAVINGYVHGYEIKSSLDTLNRLPSQLELYTKSLEKLTLVCAPRHVERIVEIAPHWCGILIASKGARGGIRFTTIRRSSVNTQVDAVQLAHLLWRAEVVELLSRLDVDKKTLKKPRKQLYKALAELLTIPEITTAIRESMELRADWRRPQVLA